MAIIANTMDIGEVRNRYLKFFEREGHVIIPSTLIVPENDPTTLFTGSGMQPILPYLLGAPHPEGKRLVDSQKCFRAEDVDEIGDNRHTTFFEMLGNWSLGDYFKKEQLPWVFSFLTDDLEIPAERLYVTVFSGDEKLQLPKDTESVALWKELFKSKGIEAVDVFMGSPDEGGAKGMQGGRIFYYDSTKNWWSRTGKPEHMPEGEPGGPDSEIFYEFTSIEHDPSFGAQCHPNCDCGRFMEIGNSVFMEYVRKGQGFERLPQRNVDFGGGLERIAAAKADSPDIFKVDILAHAIAALETLSGKSYAHADEKQVRAFRIIVDHTRAAVFIAADGVSPGNKERGYVLRRLIRRALLNAKRLGLEGVEWVGTILDIYAKDYRDFYANIDDRYESIKSVLVDEAQKFLQTLEAGLRQFDKVVASGSLKAEEIFNLYQSYGFPEELSVELAQERGIDVDEKELATFKESHRARSRSGSEKKFKGGLADTSEMSVWYHTTTHLLNQALRVVLGEHVYQKGSNITPERLRFDFPHDTKLTDEEKQKVEKLVNEKIQEKLPVSKDIMKLDEAVTSGVIGVFGERYPETVSVYRIGTSTGGYFSQEICGGPHVENTGDIKGRFVIVKEESVSKGVRRIKAVLERV